MIVVHCMCLCITYRVLTESHTGANLAAAIHRIREEFKIAEVLTISSDNAGNMKKMAKKGGFYRVPCFSHTLQLAINDALKNSQKLRRCLA